MPDPRHQASEPIGLALVYWGRLGAGAALTAEIAVALAGDPRFDLVVSTSRQSELAPPLPAERLLAIDTFDSPASLLQRTALLPRTISTLIGRLKARNVRAIVTIMPHVWGLALQRAARRAGIRTLLIVHDAEPHPGEERPLLDRLVRREMREADRVVTLSRHVADRLLALGAVQPERLATSFHPVFRFALPAAETARPHTPFRVLFFGRILPYKGVLQLLEAYAKLRAEGIDLTLRIAGRGEIGGDPALLTQPGLSIDQGWIAPEAIAPLLSEADALILPYQEASQSGVVAAAAGAGLPVVATPVGGLVEQVEDGRTGILADSVTPAGLAAAIRRLVTTPGLYRACRDGVQAAAGRMSMECFAQELGDIVLDTLPEAPLAPIRRSAAS